METPSILTCKALIVACVLCTASGYRTSWDSHRSSSRDYIRARIDRQGADAQPPTTVGPEHWLNLIAASTQLDDTYDAVGILPPTDKQVDSEIPSIHMGVGTQNYSCQQNTWHPVGAIASLYDSATGEKSGHHYFESTGLPVFALYDFGAVVAEVPPLRTPSINPGSVDDLLLTVGYAEGALKEREWSHINRVWTSGGKPPAACDVEGAMVAIPYTAYYIFFH